MTKLDIVRGCAVFVILLQACSGEQTNDIRPLADRDLTFSSTIESIGPASRAANSQWSKNDRIGVYILTSDKQTTLTENHSFTTLTGDGNFSSTTGSMIYPEETVDYKAYYPYSEDVADYIYKVNVADQSQPEKIDLLYADNLTGREPASVTGNLQFKHKLARLRLNLSSTDNSDISQLAAQVTGVPATADFNLKTGVFTLATTLASIPMKREGNSASALLIPVAGTNDVKIQLTLDGKTKEVSLPATFTSIEGGNDYVININVKNEGSSVVPEAPKYFKRTETPVITEEQLSNYKYITNFCPEDKAVRNYSILYDTNLKMAYWVAYPLCNYYTQKNVERTNEWGYDPNLSSSLQANMEKGLGGSYDRGHQIPSADRMRSKALNITTFYYTNMTPQISDMNQQIWANLEGKVRDWTSGVDTLFVVTGAMPTTATDKNITYTPDSDGKRIAVPKYYFKALARKLSGTFYTIAFKIENRTGYSSTGYMNCALSVSDLEKETGFTFFPSIDASAKATLDKSKWY